MRRYEKIYGDIFVRLLCIDWFSGGGGGGDDDLADLKGTWFGTYMDGNDDFQTMKGTLDDSIHLNIDTVDGIPVNDTATLTKIEPTMFSFTDSNGCVA